MGVRLPRAGESKTVFVRGKTKCEASGMSEKDQKVGAVEESNAFCTKVSPGKINIVGATFKDIFF